MIMSMDENYFYIKLDIKIKSIILTVDLICLLSLGMQLIIIDNKELLFLL